MLTATLSADGPSDGILLGNPVNRVTVSTAQWGDRPHPPTNALLEYSPDNGVTVPWTPFFTDVPLDFEGEPIYPLERIPLRISSTTPSSVDIDGAGYVRMSVSHYTGSSPITLSVIAAAVATGT